jgi:hypothetical protein
MAGLFGGFCLIASFSPTKAKRRPSPKPVMDQPLPPLPPPLVVWPIPALLLILDDSLLLGLGPRTPSAEARGEGGRPSNGPVYCECDGSLLAASC